MTRGRLLTGIAGVLGRRTAGAVGILVGTLLVFSALGLLVLTVMSLGGETVFGYVAVITIVCTTLGAWLVVRSIRWLRSTRGTNIRPPWQ